MSAENERTLHATTILAVRRGNSVVIGGDGQVTLGSIVMKGTARKVRRLMDGKAIGGFAGAAADGLTLFELLETKLRELGGQLLRAAVELTKEWRMDRALRRLDAMLLVADRERTLLLSGTGDVVDPDNGVAAIGSGGPYALAAARALLDNTDLSPRDIAERSLRLAGEICIYTNTNLVFEELS